MTTTWAVVKIKPSWYSLKQNVARSLLIINTLREISSKKVNEKLNVLRSAKQMQHVFKLNIGSNKNI